MMRRASLSGSIAMPSARGSAGARGFTVIELLVVMAVIAVLMAIMGPSLGRLRVTVRRIECGSNMRQLTLAWGNYARAKKMLPVANTSGVEAWVRMGDYGNTPACVTEGSIWPYVQELSMYRCPGSPYDYYVGFGMSGRLRGEWSMATRIEQVRDPANTMVLIEEYDNRGYNVNSFLVNPDAYQWVDAVAGNHEGGDNLSFADGRLEYWKWQDPQTLTYAGNHWMVDPGSKDLDRLATVWNSW